MDRTKARKPNWTDIEMDVLMEAYCNSIRIIRGKFSPSITSDAKKRAWEEITERVNAVAVSCNRTLDETKKKIQDSLSSVKKKEAFRKREASRTGGGPCSEVIFKPWEVTLLGTIPQEIIHGLEGAADTRSDADQCQPKETNFDLNCPGATGDCSATSKNVSGHWTV
ncbi:nuclear apoptosis-inducing factor 1-like [Saccostrea echinata]|uniref:nuclear apoptosis-inducing factor 1-like n=1 Tax=Saccostrea echinata TaxID=191078 RepID=UPI002A81FFD0|nr:nuclear apoptosis-inducing factor 1-like [Saccostrea echinata]XP_061191026.1 nuclear apoptosis-inducing factor 1-like [Saccostrea echinata]